MPAEDIAFWGEDLAEQLHQQQGTPHSIGGGGGSMSSKVDASWNSRGSNTQTNDAPVPIVTKKPSALAKRLLSKCKTKKAMEGDEE